MVFCQHCGSELKDSETCPCQIIPKIKLENKKITYNGKDILPKSNDKQDNQKGLIIILGIAFPILLGIVIGFTL